MAASPGRLDFRTSEDDAWWSVQLSLDEAAEVLSASYVEFPDYDAERFEAAALKTPEALEEFKARFQPAAVQAQDSECEMVIEGMVVCASHEFGKKDVRFYNAVVEEVHFLEHKRIKGEDTCMCNFLLLWQHGPMVGEKTNVGIANICFVKSQGLKVDPVLDRFFDTVKKKWETTNSVLGRTLRPTVVSTCGIGFRKRDHDSSHMEVASSSGDLRSPSENQSKEPRLSPSHVEDFHPKKKRETKKSALRGTAPPTLLSVGGSELRARDLDSSCMRVASVSGHLISTSDDQLKKPHSPPSDNEDFLPKKRRETRTSTLRGTAPPALLSTGGTELRERDLDSSLIRVASFSGDLISTSDNQLKKPQIPPSDNEDFLPRKKRETKNSTLCGTAPPALLSMGGSEPRERDLDSSLIKGSSFSGDLISTSDNQSKNSQILSSDNEDFLPMKKLEVLNSTLHGTTPPAHLSTGGSELRKRDLDSSLISTNDNQLKKPRIPPSDNEQQVTDEPLWAYHNALMQPNGMVECSYCGRNFPCNRIVRYHLACIADITEPCPSVPIYWKLFYTRYIQVLSSMSTLPDAVAGEIKRELDLEVEAGRIPPPTDHITINTGSARQAIEKDEGDSSEKDRMRDDEIDKREHHVWQRKLRMLLQRFFKQYYIPNSIVGDPDFMAACCLIAAAARAGHDVILPSPQEMDIWILSDSEDEL